MAEETLVEEVEQKSTDSREGKYLTFALGSEIYGLEILSVREIIGMMDITSVPRTPDFVKGVINLRGKVIPVIDLRLKFGMDSVEQTNETCIIVVEVNETLIGLIVDKVSEVLDIGGADIEDSPSFGGNVNTNFILGMGKTKEKVIILLDISKVLSTQEVLEISAVSEHA